MKRGETTELELELELRERHSPCSPPSSSPVREADDLAQVNHAIRLLRSTMATEALAMDLGRAHGNPELDGTLLAGWRWLRAAEKVAAPEFPQGKRRFAYFASIARNLTEADREPAAARPTNGQVRPDRETAGQAYDRRLREQLAAIEAKEARDGDA